MFDAETTARLRAAFDEVCAHVSCYDTAVRTHIASEMLQAATRGEISAEALRKAGRDALRHCRENDVS